MGDPVRLCQPDKGVKRADKSSTPPDLSSLFEDMVSGIRPCDALHRQERRVLHWRCLAYGFAQAGWFRSAASYAPGLRRGSYNGRLHCSLDPQPHERCSVCAGGAVAIIASDHPGRCSALFPLMPWVRLPRHLFPGSEAPMALVPAQGKAPWVLPKGQAPVMRRGNAI